ncbi:MAG: gamma-glutamyl-gamma-aminobutyrate hydrolase family protein [Nannocystaceae bacterium]
MLRVGVTCALDHGSVVRDAYPGKTLHFAEHAFSAAIARAGGLPLLIPALEDEHQLRRYIDHLDALVFTGGADVHPGAYDEAPLRPEWAGDPLRDAYELTLLRPALAERLPVLAVCRGHQFVNVALGGTLYQDLPTLLPGAIAHRDQARYDDHEHAVRVAPGSWLHHVVGADEVVVNSIHHQGVRTLAPGLRATAWAPDGLIEAYESIDRAHLLVGVQWHPEWMTDDHPRSESRARGDDLFAAFLSAVRDQG